jgi:hypothetical protein
VVRAHARCSDSELTDQDEGIDVAAFLSAARVIPLSFAGGGAGRAGSPIASATSGPASWAAGLTLTSWADLSARTRKKSGTWRRIRPPDRARNQNG